MPQFEASFFLSLASGEESMVRQRIVLLEGNDALFALVWVSIRKLPDQVDFALRAPHVANSTISLRAVSSFRRQDVVQLHFVCVCVRLSPF